MSTRCASRLPVSGLALLALLLLGACSFGTRLAYNNLDWLTGRWLDDYLSFTDEQQQAFDQVFDAWWLWHRQTQLPIYAATLRRLATEAEDGLDREEMAGAQRELRAYLRTAMEHSYEPFARQLQQISDAQLEELLEEYDADTEDYRRRSVDKTPAQRRERRLAKTRRALETRLGRLNAGQKQLLEDWAGQREDLAPQWLVSRQRWREDFAALMRDRRQADFSQRLRPLIFDPEKRWSAELVAAVERNAGRRQGMLEAILAQASDRQIRNLQDELYRYAEICEELAGQAASVAVPH